MLKKEIMYTDKSILITGGTGSFGRHFVASVLENYSPKRVIVYSRDELKQYEMQQRFSHKSMRYFIGDVRDRDRLTQAMTDVDYVVHAAALKQVPAAEYNPMECIKTNIHGAENVIHAAIENRVEKVVSLSTDKAVNPKNLYGATKLASDKLFVAANNVVGKGVTRFSVVRYGNVMGSRGSVVEKYRNLISQPSEYLPVTDVRMTRFWITLEDSINFVLETIERMQGGEIFVPKIPSIRIIDLATAIAPKMRQKIVGIRAGEKLHEVLCPNHDAHLTFEYPNHYVISPAIQFNDSFDFSIDKLGAKGQIVSDEFEYNSLDNSHFLTVDEIREYGIKDRLTRTSEE